jgi:hypothetical protein
MIFGEASPKFIGSDDVHVNLDHVLIPFEVDRPDFKTIVHESTINRDRNFVHRKAHWDWTGVLLLFQYSDPLAKYEQLMTYLYDQVTFYRHRDKDPFKDSSGTIVPFVITEIEPFYFTNGFRQDAVRISLTSTKVVDIVKSTVATLITEKTEQNVLTEDGQSIIIG